MLEGLAIDRRVTLVLQSLTWQCSPHGFKRQRSPTFPTKVLSKRNYWEWGGNEIWSVCRRKGRGGKREELISGVVDHYPRHACVIALITPSLTHHPQTTDKLSTQWQTEDIRVLVPKHAALQNDPVPPPAPKFLISSLFSASLLSRFRPVPGGAESFIIVPLIYPHMVVENKSPPFFLQVDTESPLLSCAALRYLCEPARSVPH